jgi:DNA-binding winged helix-turn-helix (wHTH) protein
VRYAFSRFVLDTDTRQLLEGAVEVHLSPKAFELLNLLLVNRPRAVSKAELQEHLWPSTFVEETNLASLVAEIRRALHDEATQPAFVRTVYRFGYRFVGEVAEHAALARHMPRPARPCLRVENRLLFLLEGENVIGREPDVAIPCNFPGVSRYHARICVSMGEATLEDLGSKNGTFVQGQRVTSARLSNGDEIRLGSVTLIFQMAPPLGETETVTTEPS